MHATAREREAHQLIEWADARFRDGLVLSTSFGIQSALMLHLVTRVKPDVPVVWVDTGYLPPETYRFAEQLREHLDLDLRVYQADLGPARMEALYGRLWERDEPDALDLYDRMRKVEPMQRALEDLGATAWLSGLRAEQTAHRKTLEAVSEQGGRTKLLPILHWSARDVHDYFERHDLAYHPLFDQGYTSVGDAHSSRPRTARDTHERETRFRGLKEECGLHL